MGPVLDGTGFLATGLQAKVWLIFFPFVGEILCPVLLTLAHTQCFADRISSPAQHCQYMTSEHIKLSWFK